MHTGIVRLLIVGLILPMLILNAGCGKKGPKYPEDHARFKRIVSAIDILKSAYIKKDPDTIHGLLLPLDTLGKWEATVREDFATFSEIELDMTIERVIIQEGSISSFVTWHGKWKRTPDSPPFIARGQGTLLWSGTQVILLRRVEGDLPFGITTNPNFPA
jgi:hypothetical protein